MTQWIAIVALYAAGFGLLGLLGGLRSAGEALRSWGAAAGGDGSP